MLETVDATIAANEGTYLGDAEHYFGVGLSAIRCIDAAMIAGGVIGADAVLDLPCGHGRVLRFLAQRFPHATFTACDLDRDAVDFCARTFGARAADSRADLDAVELPARFDLIWCGSLATHLDAAGIDALLRLFARHLIPGGMCVFTTHGALVAERQLTGEFDYGLAPAQARGLEAAYRQSGFGYTDYADNHGYGVSLSAPEWIRTRAAEVGSLREVFFAPAAWDSHQDVFGFVKHG